MSSTTDISNLEFGLLVTSNRSQSHIVWENEKTPCGISHNMEDSRFSNSEVRWYLPADEFKMFVHEMRNISDDGYRFCKHCLKAYDKLISLNNN